MPIQKQGAGVGDDAPRIPAELGREGPVKAVVPENTEDQGVPCRRVGVDWGRPVEAACVEDGAGGIGLGGPTLSLE